MLEKKDGGGPTYSLILVNPILLDGLCNVVLVAPLAFFGLTALAVESS